MRLFLRIIAGLAILWPVLASADTWPSRTVTFIVPFAPGGSADVTARLLATELSDRLGQAFVVENQPGGGSIIGTRYVAKAAPDGHTLLMTSSAIAITPHLNDLDYDPTKDLAPVSQVMETRGVVLVGATSPLTSIEDLFDAMKARPGEISYGSAGNGSGTHLWAAEMLHDAGLQAVHIPYKGAGPAKTGAMSGEVDFITDAIGAAMGQITGNQLRPLAVLSAERDGSLPDVPTLAETVIPGFEFGSWVALFAPAGTPPETVDAISTAMRDILDTPEMKDLVKRQGLIAAPSTPGDLAILLDAESRRYADLIEATGLAPE
ncbi:Bug family tripartite tricarboxylate transporter substrate binding protein [Paracoccus versutus]|uniref:Tripartite-type tricarboxylate transporter receptor subunit TctC n=1 Tax=Paracoccus versutus TaxID=34007 RepID=A0A3D9XSB0_PARVE|nr:tripartite tricarboxylate transporter substrate binding protein [Paracoccus versutus]REF73285.1 tripartite-type tricarboxylate transporter receptor subunit TctC [Paracoccus versutus]